MKKLHIGKKWIWLIVAGVVIIGVILGVVLSSGKTQKTALANLQTVTLEKGDLTAVIGATGTVRSNQSAILPWQTSGIISRVNVAVGDKVVKDKVLMELDSTTVPPDIIHGYVDLTNAKLALDSAKSDTSTANAKLALANAQDAYDTALGNSWIIGRPVGSAHSIEATELSLEIARATLEKASKRVTKLSYLQDDDLAKLTAQQAEVNAAQNVRTLEVQLSYLKNVPDTNNTAILNGELEVAKAQLDAAQRAFNRVKDGPNVDDVAMAQANVDAAQAVVNKMKITAPFSGVVVDLKGLEGDLVSYGSNAVRIDDLSRLLVDVQVPEVDINSVKVGQDVKITFDAINDSEYSGKVSVVGKAGTISNGNVNFDVTIEILNPDGQVLPGMTAAISIVVNDLKQVLTVPNRAVRLLDSKHVVYILRNNFPTAIPVEIGASSDTVSEILSGDLKVGDLIILNPPTDFSSFRSGRPPF
jgi:HlyD family secretion protein